VIQLITINFLS